MSMTKSEKIAHIKEVYKHNGCHYSIAREVGIKLGFSVQEINKILKIREKKGIGAREV